MVVCNAEVDCPAGDGAGPSEQAMEAGGVLVITVVSLGIIFMSIIVVL